MLFRSLVSSRDGNVYSILGSDKKHRLYEIVSLAKNNKFIDDVQMKSLEKILVDLDERIPTDYISIIKKQLKHIVENEPDCDFAVQGKYEKAINLLDELQRTDPLLVKEAAIKSDEIDFDSLEKSMRNSLKNNTQEGKTKDFTYDWKAFTEEDFNALKNKCQEPYPSDDFAGRVRIGTIDIDIVVRNDGENNYPSFDYYLLGKEGEGHTEKGNIPYDFLDGVDFKAHQIDKMSYSDFKEAFEILCHDKTLSLKKEIGRAHV